MHWIRFPLVEPEYPWNTRVQRRFPSAGNSEFCLLRWRTSSTNPYHSAVNLLHSEIQVAEPCEPLCAHTKDRSLLQGTIQPAMLLSRNCQVTVDRNKQTAVMVRDTKTEWFYAFCLCLLSRNRAYSAGVRLYVYVFQICYHCVAPGQCCCNLRQAGLMWLACVSFKSPKYW
jgi:hypothetical protein